jgi:hypothetical protein
VSIPPATKVLRRLSPPVIEGKHTMDFTPDGISRAVKPPGAASPEAPARTTG